MFIKKCKILAKCDTRTEYVYCCHFTITCFWLSCEKYMYINLVLPMLRLFTKKWIKYILNYRSLLSYLFLPFWCVFYVRQAIKTAARDLVLHGIVSQSNRPSIVNGVRFYDCCSNINCRLSRSKKLQISILPEF
jgi:riboflavin transporter FmnP